MFSCRAVLELGSILPTGRFRCAVRSDSAGTASLHLLVPSTLGADEPRPHRRPTVLPGDDAQIPRAGGAAHHGARARRRSPTGSTARGGPAVRSSAGRRSSCPKTTVAGASRGEGVVDLAIVAEEMGRLVSPGPLVPTNVVADAVARGGSAALRAEVLPGIVAGEIVAAWCIAGPGGGWDEHGVAVGAVRDGASSDGGLVLDGVSSPVEYAAQADELLVTARTDGGLTQCLVPASAPGVHIEAIESVDLVRRFATVHFEGVQVSPRSDRRRDRRRRRRGRAPAAPRVVLQCAETVGALDRVLDVHPRVPRRPQLVRPAARVVPGDQAPHRRHEDVDRGQPRRHRARGAGGAGRRSRSGRDRRARRRRTSATTPARSCRSARSCTAASASRGSTTCTSTCGGSPSTATCSARPRSTASASPTAIIARHGASIEPEVAGA